MIGVCSITCVISASYYNEVNVHCFMKLFQFRCTQKYTLDFALDGAVRGAIERGSVKVLSTSSTIIWSHEIKVLF